LLTTVTKLAINQLWSEKQFKMCNNAVAVQK